MPAAYDVDLLSDTLTRPTEAMRHAMATAEVGDDVFGEDPTVRALEERVAGLLGHEDALFTPTGSMANQLGIRLHVAQGEELVVVENTHNFCGGTVQPLDQIEALRAGTQPRGVAMHLDGARLWNAHVATGVGLAEYGQHFDSVSVCLSKGLGAP